MGSLPSKKRIFERSSKGKERRSMKRARPPTLTVLAKTIYLTLATRILGILTLISMQMKMQRNPLQRKLKSLRSKIQLRRRMSRPSRK